MKPLRICAGVATWRDGRRALEPCLKSIAPFVDEIVIADGLLDGIDPQGLPSFSNLAWLDGEDVEWLPPRMPMASREWQTQSQQRTWILHQAKKLECEWLFFIDADEELHQGERLRMWLDQYGDDAFPMPFLNGNWQRAPFKLLRVSAWWQFKCAGMFCEHRDGNTYPLLSSSEATNHQPPGALSPWLSHHPERRTPERNGIRLGELEMKLESRPAVVTDRLWGLQEPRRVVEVHLMDPGEPTWFCDQCGKRYFGPGVCLNSHPPAELKLVNDPNAPVSAAAPAAAAAPDTSPVEVSPPAPPEMVTTPPVEEPAAPDDHAEALSLIERGLQLLRNL